MNRVILTGRTTNEIELRYTQGENSLAYVRFNLAVSRPKKDNEADFIACQAWGKTAELLDKYVSKGDKIAVEGFIRTGSYEKNGQRIYTSDVVVEKVEFISAKPKEQKQESIPDGFSQLDEDMPF